MIQLLRIAEWNANGLSDRRQELETFIYSNKLDIVLIAETRYTVKNYLKIPAYSTYLTNHPSGNTHGGTAVIINSKIKHYEIEKYEKDFLQATSVIVETNQGPITVSATYCPPKHKICKAEFNKYLKSLGPKFIAGGDWNAKHVYWGSRLTLHRGRQLYEAITENHCNSMSTGKPTYWPTDPNKIPDLLDFFITRNITKEHSLVQPADDLSSDHSPIIINVSSEIILKETILHLTNNHTDWTTFQSHIEDNLKLNIPLKSQEDIERAVEHLNNTVVSAAYLATPEVKNTFNQADYPWDIRKKISERRNLRRTWHQTRNPEDKRALNRASRHLSVLIEKSKNETIQKYLSKVEPNTSSDNSIWKATKKLKQPTLAIPPIRNMDRSWARSSKEKADTFGAHLANVFRPNEPATDEAREHTEEIKELITAPFQMSRPIKPARPAEVHRVLSNLKIKKAPGYDLITPLMLKRLPRKAVVLLTTIINAILRTGHYPAQWKIAQILMIAKPGKQPNEATSYRPLSLLPIISKVFEKVLLARIKPYLVDIIPQHQFGFREKHATIEQVHRLVNEITSSLENKEYCSAAFLDISQAFDKVWHLGLKHKLKNQLPHPIYSVLNSYLSNRCFQVRHDDELSSLYPIESGIPQGSVLGPVLYILFTSDLPTTEETVAGTFADDTAYLASHKDPEIASQNLQTALYKMEKWCNKWRIKANESKSVHVTFTLRRETCPTVYLNAQPIPKAEDAKYLGMHLDRRLTWRKHIWTKRKQLDCRLRSMDWLIGRRSQLSAECKILVYKAIIKPIWTYGIQLWGTACKSNIAILERFQTKTLRRILGIPWHIANNLMYMDLKIPTVAEEIKKASLTYQSRLFHHPNELASALLTDNAPKFTRLKKKNILELKL